MRTALLLLALVAACNSSPSPPGDQLVGTYSFQINETCGEGWTFKGDATYVHQMLCLTAVTGTSASAQTEAEAGRFQADGARLELTPGSASCPGGGDGATALTAPRQTAHVDYALVDKGALRLTFQNGIFLLQRVPDGGGGGISFQITTGCWRMGSFAAGPMVPIASP